MKKININQYQRDAVQYTAHDQYFTHNFSNDFQIILLKHSDFEVNEQLLATCHQVVAKYDINWTPQNLSGNKKRLGILKDELAEYAGQGEIHLKAIIVSIDNAQYQKDVAGDYHIYWHSTELNTLVKRAVVVSNSIEEFFYYAALLIGPTLMEQLTSFSSEILPCYVVGDLIGAEGWNSFEELLSVTALCCDWLVLRNGEFLPDNFWGNDKDMDILCRELTPFLLAINAGRKGQSMANFYVTVEGQMLDVDARFVGDDYYDRRWQEDMLLTKTYQGVVPQLNIEHYFYSLLYHARIHKNVVKDIYVPRLSEMAEAIKLNFDERILFNDRSCAQFIDEYFKLKGYKFTYPQDYACYENINRKVSRHITHVKAMPFNADFAWRLLKHRVFLGLCKILPRSLKDDVKRVLNR